MSDFILLHTYRDRNPVILNKKNIVIVTSSHDRSRSIVSTMADNEIEVDETVHEILDILKLSESKL